jgi:iron complex transport system substrate-binding protein
MRSLSSIVISLLLTLVLAFSATAQEGYTLQTDEALQPAISALYQARYGAQPTFVEADGDLIATADPALLPAGGLVPPPHFLPEAFFLLTNANAEAQAFIDFAISPDGQEVLIEAGFLPRTTTITDQAGNDVEITLPVRRVVTPFSLATYMVYAVGADDRLVAGGYLGARSPIGASRMEAIDPRFPVLSAYVLNQREINIEEVANLAPDVIFTSARTVWLDSVRELNIPLVLFQGESPELLAQAMRMMGQVFGPNAAARAEAWISYYEDILTTVTGATDTLSEDERPSVLLVGEEALRVISGQMYQTSIIRAAGGQSVSAELTGGWNDVNLEQIVLWNPDVIVIVPYGAVTPQTLLESPEWSAIEAVQNGRVYKMPAWVAPWDTPVPDSVLGVIWLTQKLYGDTVGLDCAREAQAFFSAFYGADLPEAELAAVCAS